MIAYEDQGGRRITSPDSWLLDPEAVAVVGADLAMRHSVLPIGIDTAQSMLYLAMTRPEDSVRQKAIADGVGQHYDFRWIEVGEDVVREGLVRCYGENARARGMAQISPYSDDANAVLQVDCWLREAIDARASDLHIQAMESGLVVRLRVDGCMQHHARLYVGSNAIVNRIKIMADMDIADTRRPQDGRLHRWVSTRWVDLRVSSFPLIYGESLVIRIHDRDCTFQSLSSLGMDAMALADLRRVIAAKAGLIVLSGPTGSGKTTTLYALLHALNDGSRNIMTLEDPVEHVLPGVAQASVDPSRAIDFASGLRALLRQDPDVLMLGEIRDADSCRIAIRAALTGLRVFATVHAGNSTLAVDRLLELGADKDELAATLVASLAQRLLRRQDVAGRMAVIETLWIDEAMRRLIKAQASFSGQRGSEAPRPLEHIAQAAVAAGRVDPAEYQRVFGSIPRKQQEVQGCTQKVLSA